MLATYTFNSEYQTQGQNHPQLRLLEGGKFATGEYAPVLIREDQRLRLKYFRWGLRSRMMQVRPSNKAQTFIAREQVLRKPGQVALLRRQRCLIPADGCYMPGISSHHQRLFKLSMPQGQTFCIAGIYELYQREDGEILPCFAMLTAPSPSHLQRFGVRMPMILPKNLETTWLNPHIDLNKLQKLLQLPTGSGLSVHPVQELILPEVTPLDHVAA